MRWAKRTGPDLLGGAALGLTCCYGLRLTGTEWTGTTPLARAACGGLWLGGEWSEGGGNGETEL